MGASFTIDMSRLDALVRSLDFESGKGSAARDVLRAANRLDTKLNREAFKSEGASLGTLWPENNPRWKSFKKTTTGSDQPLVFRGRLRDSLTKTSNPDRIANLKDFSITLGTSVPYADKHRRSHTAPRFTAREGGRSFDSRKPWRVPARDFLARKPDQIEDMSAELSQVAKAAALKALESARLRGGALPSEGRLVILGGDDVRSFLNQRTTGPRGGLR